AYYCAAWDSSLSAYVF
nr:immunoglobulin light chain junction region [Macaca mulatta]